MASTGSVVWDAGVLAVPLGLITVSVLHANNTVDIETDAAAGIRTFAMLIGGKASSILYKVYMMLPFVCMLCFVIVGWLHPLALLSLAAYLTADTKKISLRSHAFQYLRASSRTYCQ